MPIKISQLTELTVIDGTVVVPVVDNSGATPVSKKSTAATLSSYILSGNAATATKLVTARNINGVAFDGTADIAITTDLATATDTVKGGVIIGAGINVALDGTISAPTRKFHGFSVDSNSNLIYSTTEDSTINLQDSTGEDIYESVDIGTNEYAYSLDANGNLIVTYS